MSSFRRPFGTNSRRKTEHATEQTLYEMCGPWAKKFKIGLQFLIGIGLALLLLAKTFVAVSFLGPPLCRLIPWVCRALRIQQLVALPTLALVAKALEYSAGFELAYTLFTEGPDEAVEPVIMGLAAAMLLGLSKLDRIDVLAGCGAVVFVIALAGLFFIRKRFVLSEDESAGVVTSRQHR